MRSIATCLVLLCGLTGSVGLSLASVPALNSLSPWGMAAQAESSERPEKTEAPIVRTAMEIAMGGAQSATAPAGGSLQPLRERACADLDHAVEQAWQGDAQAQYWLALQYEGGRCGLCKDDPLAVVWFKKAAAAGNADARFALGIRCFFGHGAPRNLEQAVYWLHMAAQQGHAEAQYRLAGCLEDGLGAIADKAAALDWYSKSAELGYPQAQNMLGIFYMNGTGLPRDKHAAAVWFQRAAMQGYATAQFNLGRSYEMGDGVDKDREKALYWYGKAARQGDADAQARLDAL